MSYYNNANSTALVHTKIVTIMIAHSLNLLTRKIPIFKRISLHYQEKLCSFIGKYICIEKCP